MKIMTETKKIDQNDFCRMFKCHPDELPVQLISGLEMINTNFREPTLREFEEHVLNVLKQINGPHISRTKKENLEAFEKGWRNNLEMLIASGGTSYSLKPGYFRPNKFLRYNKVLIVTDNHNLEYELFNMARYLLFTRYLSPYEHIYELGSGSCQNLLLLSELFPTKTLFGLDWTTASAEIAHYLSKARNKRIEGVIFDMTNPSPDFVIRPESAVITIHALEQIGRNHGKLISFLMDAKPGLVLHYEPIIEFYNDNNLLDYLAILYSKRRNYLYGFLTELQRLEGESKIEIIAAWRPYLGGIIHESSVIIWRPK